MEVSRMNYYFTGILIILMTLLAFWLAEEMSKCKNCHWNCHCDGDLHADEYGLCACSDCKCKRT